VVEGALRTVLLGMAILLVAILVGTLTSGQPWVAISAALGAIGIVVAIRGFTEG
jgi:hypothetical protein